MFCVLLNVIKKNVDSEYLKYSINGRAVRKIFEGGTDSREGMLYKKLIQNLI